MFKKILKAISDFLTGEGFLKSLVRSIFYLGIVTAVLLVKTKETTVAVIIAKYFTLLFFFLYFSIYRLIVRNKLPEERRFSRKAGFVVFILLAIIIYFLTQKLPAWLKIFNSTNSNDSFTVSVIMVSALFIFIISLYMFSIKDDKKFDIFGDGQRSFLVRFLLAFSILAADALIASDTKLLYIIPSFSFIYLCIYGYIRRKVLPAHERTVRIIGNSIFFILISALLLILIFKPIEPFMFVTGEEFANYYTMAGAPLTFIAFILLFMGHKKKEPDPDENLIHSPFSYLNFKGAGIDVGTPLDYHAPGYGKLFSDYKDKDIVVDPASLSKTTLICGNMGQGKTRLMKLYYDKIRELHPNSPIIIHDPKGEWVKSCYNPETDLIFSPLDSRSVAWDIWKDFSLHPELIHLISKSVITSHGKTTSSDGNYWIDSATDLLQNGITASKDIFELAKYFNEQKAKEEGNKTFLSTYSTAKLSLKDIASISLIKSEKKMTLDDFIAHKGNIFLLNPVVSRGENKGPLSIFLTAFLMNALSRPDVPENKLRMTAIVDESLLFELPDEVEDAVYTMARSKGVAIIASILALPLDQHQKATHLTKSQTIFVFKTSDLKTREYFSDSVGSIMYDDRRISTSSQHQGMQGSSSETISYERREHKAIFQEMFYNLDKREFFLMRDGLIKGYLRDVEMESKDHEVLIYNRDLKKMVQEYITIL